METILYDITRRHTLTRVGKVNDHRKTAIQFTGFNLEPEQTLYVAIIQRGKQKVIPMTDTTFVIGKPLTLHPGDFRLQLEIRGGTKEWDTDWFPFRIDPHNHEHDCCCHHDHCNDDPNVQRWVELIKYKLEDLEANQLTAEDIELLFEEHELTPGQIQQVLSEVKFEVADGSITYEKLSKEVQDMLDVTYEQLKDKPEINDVVLVGKKSLTDLGINIPECATPSDIDIAIFTN